MHPGLDINEDQIWRVKKILVFNLLKGCNKLNNHPNNKGSVINLQAYLHYKMFKLYKATTLNDVNLLRAAKLVGCELLLPLAHSGDQAGFQDLSFAVWTAWSQELALMLRLQMELGREQRPRLVEAAAMERQRSTARG